MKKVLLGLSTLLFLFSGCANKQSRFQSVPASQATIMQEGEDKNYCPICGMHIPTFYKTSHAATTKEGEVRQYCSIHCVVDDHEHNKSGLSEIKVVDLPTLKYVEAKSATYVVGSDKSGTMSMISKYAFANKADAESFQKSYGGMLMSFEEAYNVSKGDFEKDMAMIADNKGKAKFMGGILYGINCETIDKQFATPLLAKRYINANKSCGDIDEMKLHAISIHLSEQQH
jgi:nitrous oxide reductase accessory protein NosL